MPFSPSRGPSVARCYESASSVAKWSPPVLGHRGDQWRTYDGLSMAMCGVVKQGSALLVNWNHVDTRLAVNTNLPEIARLFSPTIFFIDTVFAWPLVTCEDAAHPMTRLDDLQWKTRLCLLAKQHFGLFGSEEGREWSVPCADYLEGIFGHQTDSPPGSVVSLFPLVYSDCAQIMTHQGNRIGPGDEKKVADHVLLAEMPLPQFGYHLYWTEPKAPDARIVPLTPVVNDLGDRKFEITYRWRAEAPLSDDYSAFVHFTQKRSDRAEDSRSPAPRFLDARTSCPASSALGAEYNGLLDEVYSGDFSIP